MGLDRDGAHFGGPVSLSATGGTVVGDGDGIAAAVGSLETALSGADAMFGHDAAGLAFAQGYMASGKGLLDAAASAVNACRRVGFGVQASAANYGHANASSTVGGGTSPVPVPTAAAQFSSPSMPPPYGGAIAAPMGWTLVEAFIGDVWPDGNPGELRAAAGSWRSFATAMSGLVGQVNAEAPGLSAQQIPEAGQMSGALGEIGLGLGQIAAEAQKLATSVGGFAEAVDATQNAVRSLLDQLSLSGVFETIGGIFTGENPLDKVREVAHEIKVVLDNMKREADATSAMFSQGINMLDSATTSLEKWANKEFTDAFGREVGAALSADFSAIVDLPEGGLKFVAETAQGLSQLDPTRFAYDPPGAAKTWTGTLEGLSTVLNPATLAMDVVTDPQGSLDTVKGLVDWKDVEAGHPFRALGYDTGQVASALIPGVGEASPAVIAGEVEGRAAVTSAEVEARGAAGASRDVIPGLTGTSGASESIASQTSRISSDLNGVKVPESAPPGAAPGASAPTGRAPVDAPAPTAESSGGGRAPVDTPPPASNAGSHVPDSVSAPEEPAPQSHLVPPADSAEPAAPRSAEPAPAQADPPPPPSSHSVEPAQVAASDSPPPPFGGGSSYEPAPAATEPSKPLGNSGSIDNGGEVSATATGERGAALAEGGPQDHGSTEGGESAHHDPVAGKAPTPHGDPHPHGGPDPRGGHDPHGDPDPRGGHDPHGGDGAPDKPEDASRHIPPEDFPPLMTREEPYETGSIKPQYVGEQYPGGHFSFTGSDGVTYLDEVDRAKYRVFIDDGYLYNSRGELLDTSNGVSAFGADSNGRAIFVMDQNGNLFASKYHSAGVFHHSTFFAGGDVAAAGELIVKDGRIETITDRSGHYQPGRSQTMQMLDQLASQGIDLNEVILDICAP